MDFSEKQKEFMVAGGQTVTEWNLDQALRYVNHIKEEVKELHDAVAGSDWVKAVDAAADLKVVANGFLFSLGIEPWEVDLCVCLANQRKLVDGKVYRRPDGQIGKPPGWVGPEAALEKIVKEVQP